MRIDRLHRLIVEWDMPHLGMFQLRTRGETRFSVSPPTPPDGLIEAEVELLTRNPAQPMKRG